jgi:peptide/nickel transport system permease protein
VGRYLIRRVLFLILVILIVSLLTFLIFVKLPAGDPARRAVGRTTTPEQIQNARVAFGLDKPLYIQYWRFLRGFIPWPPDQPLKMALGQAPDPEGPWLDSTEPDGPYYSYGNFIPVKEEVSRRLPITGTLAIGAAVVWLLLGIPIGILSGVRRRSIADRAAMIFAIVGVSMPIFWLAQLLLYAFWFKLEWAPPSGIPIGYNGWGGALRAAAEGRFLLPWISLAYINAAFYARMVRGNLIETMNEDYIRTARSKGLSERRVIYKHGLRGALTPVVTMLGLDVGLLLGGAFITETVFRLPGMGQLAVIAIGTNDFPMVMGVTIIGAFIIALANLVVDVAYAFLDPRVRYT